MSELVQDIIYQVEERVRKLEAKASQLEFDGNPSLSQLDEARESREWAEKLRAFATSLPDLIEAAKPLIEALEEHELECISNGKTPETFECLVATTDLMALRSALRKGGVE